MLMYERHMYKLDAVVDLVAFRYQLKTTLSVR